MSEPNLILRDIRRAFLQPDGELEVLRGCSAQIMPGELVAMVGMSGSGKSTLLQICGLLDNPTSGTLEIGGHGVESLSDRERTRLRRGTVGFVYQFHHLLPEFTALENVILPQSVAGVPAVAARARAHAAGPGRLGASARPSTRQALRWGETTCCSRSCNR